MIRITTTVVLLPLVAFVVPLLLLAAWVGEVVADYRQAAVHQAPFD